MKGSGTLQINLLGTLEIRRGSQPVELPASKKTRAILAYLIANSGRHRRERLSELLWDVADDPRGGLRWCLSKIRPLVDDAQCPRLLADRETVEFCANKADVDLYFVRETLRNGTSRLTLQDLETLAARFRGTLLEGLELPDHGGFQAWLVAAREDALRQRVLIHQAIVKELWDEPEEALPYGRLLVQVDPLDENSRSQLCRLLLKLGRHSEARQLIDTGKRLASEFAGSGSGELAIVERELSRSGSAVRHDSSKEITPPIETMVVGRDEALSRMRRWLEKMLGGERQVVFVTGEAGIGKTSLVNTFARRIASDPKIRLGQGQCLEQYGTGEAYLPVLEAVGRLGREQPEVVDALRTHAPMWLLQMPSLLSTPDRELVSQEVLGATRERMLREMVEALEALTSDRPLVLILEDLHWSDYSTLDLISYLARRRQPARLMVIGTYRPVELIVSGHPLMAVKRELLAKQECEELPLEYLSEEAVARYLSVRFPAHRFPAELALLIHERTEGSPLFMVNAVDYLVAEGSIVENKGHWTLVVGIENVEVGVPDSIKQMIEKQLDHLDAEQQQTLEAASVAGAEFSALMVAAGLAGDRTAIETRCDELARQHQFIQDCGVQELPNGETVTQYGFIHALYQNVLYERVSASKRVQFHRRIGERGEALYGERAAEIATELAMHFERGSNYEQAVKYLQQAAENAIRRFAYQESVGLSRRGVELIRKLPGTPERARQELRLLITLGVPLIATQGYAAPDVGRAYTRARELCRQLGNTPEISEVLWGLWTFYLVRAELGITREIAEEFVRVAERLPYSWLAMEVTLVTLGEFEPALEHFEKALSLYDPERHRDDAARYSQHPGVGSRGHAAWTLWFTGQPDQALDRIEECITLARELAAPHGLAHSLFFAAVLHLLRREEQMALERAEAACAVSGEHGLMLYHAMATITRGRALLERGSHEKAITEIRQGLADHRATGTEVLRPHFLALLAEALGRAGQSEGGLQILDEALALAYRTGERYFQAELYRLKGELLRMAEPSATEKAESCFDHSIKIAQRQKARSLELRAAMSLARLYQDQGSQEKARGILAPIYEKFTEGFETKDLREAKTMIDELSRLKANHIRTSSGNSIADCDEFR